MPAFLDLTGQKFGRLTVIERIGTRNDSPLWLCDCACGNTAEVITRCLQTGDTRSCKCLRSVPNKYEHLADGTTVITIERRNGDKHQCFIDGADYDHIDHNGLNNRRSNLRPATQSLNNANARKKVGGTSKFRGVSWNTGRARFVANITVNKNQKYLGEFDSEEAAALMYNIYAKRFFGEFATLNQLPTRFIPVRAITIVPQRRAK